MAIKAFPTRTTDRFPPPYGRYIVDVPRQCVFAGTASVPRPEPLRNVSVGEILGEAVGLEPARWTRGGQMRVSADLNANGWERCRRRDEGGREATREWRYRRQPSA